MKIFFIDVFCIAMRPGEDTYRHKGLRKKLVDTIRDKGISDEKVLKAINTIPRHFFLDSAFDQVAYEDRAFPIGEGQTISQPYTVAYQSQLLDVKPLKKYWRLEPVAPIRPAYWRRWALLYIQLSARKPCLTRTKLLITLKSIPISNFFTVMDTRVCRLSHPLIR